MMQLRTPLLASLVVFAAALTVPNDAAAQAPAGDAERGVSLAYTCNGCHAIPNYKNVYPTYSVPKLRNQRPEYIVAALKEYRSGDRSHGTMHSQAASLSDQDMADIAAYLAGPNVLTASRSDAPASARPKATDTCMACHGTNGVGVTGDFPTLAGQHKDYIEQALHQYQRGARKNPIMAPQATNLSPEDIKALAEYYSSQDPSLEVVKKRSFFFSSK